MKLPLCSFNTNGLWYLLLSSIATREMIYYRPWFGSGIHTQRDSVCVDIWQCRFEFGCFLSTSLLSNFSFRPPTIHLSHHFQMERGEPSSAAERSPRTREHPPIDEAIARIVSGQTNAENVATLDTLTAAQLLSYTSDGLDPLTVLNPVSHSLAYLYFM